jgi:cyanate lyase
MTKEECTQLIVSAMFEKSINFQVVADAIGKDIVWTTSALLGQNSMSEEEAQIVTTLLSLGAKEKKALQLYPNKAVNAIMPPTDPLIYRLYEIVLVYGETIKAVIHEKMGDGIMSAIDFSMNIEKIENPNGDRVKITMEGKFLPYKKW